MKKCDKRVGGVKKRKFPLRNILTVLYGANPHKNFISERCQKCILVDLSIIKGTYLDHVFFLFQRINLKLFND